MIKYLVEMTKADVREKHYNLDRNAVRMTPKQEGLSAGINKLIKTSDGVKAELDLNKLSDKCRTEIERCVSKSNDNLTLLYHERSDTISFAENSKKPLRKTKMSGRALWKMLKPLFSRIMKSLLRK